MQQGDGATNEEKHRETYSETVVVPGISSMTTGTARDVPCNLDPGDEILEVAVRFYGGAVPATDSDVGQGNYVDEKYDEAIAYTDSVKSLGTVVSSTAATIDLTTGQTHCNADASSNAITVNLPSPATAVQVVTIKKVDSSGNAVTIAGTSSELPVSIAVQFETRTLYPDGSNWWIQ